MASVPLGLRGLLAVVRVPGGASVARRIVVSVRGSQPMAARGWRTSVWGCHAVPSSPSSVGWLVGWLASSSLGWLAGWAAAEGGRSLLLLGAWLVGWLALAGGRVRLLLSLGWLVGWASQAARRCSSWWPLARAWPVAAVAFAAAVLLRHAARARGRSRGHPPTAALCASLGSGAGAPARLGPWVWSSRAQSGGAVCFPRPTQARGRFPPS